MKYGLPTATTEKICAVLARFPQIDRAVIYGSRAKGNFKPGSDIDLTLFGENLTSSQLGKIAEAFDDLLLPYTIDLSLYAELNHAKLRDHIDRVGMVFYERRHAGKNAGTAVKKGWETKTLGEVCEIIMGQSPDGESYNTTGEGVPLINGPVEFSAESFGKTLRTKFTTQPTKFCKEGDLILCVRGSTTGRMNIAGFDACVGRGVAAIRAKQYQPWINHFISSKRDEIHGKGTGATFPNVSGNSLANFELVVPPLPEQQRIVGLLDEAFEGIATAKANAEKNLQNARALFESHLNEVFTKRGDGWVETTLPRISTNLDNKRVPITKNVRNNGQYPYYGASGIVDYVADYIFDGNNLLISEDGANLLARSTPIAFSVSGKYWVNNHAHILNFENMATQRFVEFYLESIKLDEYITGAAQPKLNQKALNSIPIPTPTSVEDQKGIVERVESLQEETQRLAAIYERKLAALEALKKSLLHQAFNGEL